MGQKSRKRQRVGRGVASAACRDTCGRFTGRDEAAAAAAPSDDTPTASHDVEHTADVDHASDGDCADSDSITFLHSDTWYEGGEFADKTVSDEVQWHDDDNLIDVSMELRAMVEWRSFQIRLIHSEHSSRRITRNLT